MPIYEFYCADCHTVFNFWSQRVNTEKTPACPRCDRAQLMRKLSVFAISKNRSEAEPDMPDIDESKMEQVLAAMGPDLEKLDEDDPQAAAAMMRKLFDASGADMSDGMAEALRRMDAGEDPDQIEADLGEVLENEDPFSGSAKSKVKALRRKLLPPQVDETLHDL